jgi:hypothetical protein
MGKEKEVWKGAVGECIAGKDGKRSDVSGCREKEACKETHGGLKQCIRPSAVRVDFSPGRAGRCSCQQLLCKIRRDGRCVGPRRHTYLGLGGTFFSALCVTSLPGLQRPPHWPLPSP